MVSKKGRVAEDIGINKTSAGRTETISDSVRKTEVEVDDQRIEQKQMASARARASSAGNQGRAVGLSDRPPQGPGRIAMPLYFFHVKHFEGVDEDLEGISFETVEDAKASAADTLREAVATDMRAALPIDTSGIEITNPSGAVVALVSVEDAAMSELDTKSPG